MDRLDHRSADRAVGRQTGPWVGRPGRRRAYLVELWCHIVDVEDVDENVGGGGSDRHAEIIGRHNKVQLLYLFVVQPLYGLDNSCRKPKKMHFRTVTKKTNVKFM